MKECLWPTCRHPHDGQCFTLKCTPAHSRLHDKRPDRDWEVNPDWEQSEVYDLIVRTRSCTSVAVRVVEHGRTCMSDVMVILLIVINKLQSLAVSRLPHAVYIGGMTTSVGTLATSLFDTFWVSRMNLYMYKILHLCMLALKKVWLHVGFNLFDPFASSSYYCLERRVTSLMSPYM